jgi:hypothetical protein
LPAHGRVYQKGHELVFTITAETDAGVYTCHAANLAGERRQDVNITVASEYFFPEGEREEEAAGSQEVLGSRCDGQRLPCCSPGALLALGSAALGISPCLSTPVGVDSSK